MFFPFIPKGQDKLFHPSFATEYPEIFCILGSVETGEKRY